MRKPSLRVYDPIAALSQDPTRRRPPSFGAVESWDFEEDPMLWARTQYGRVSQEALFAEPRRRISKRAPKRGYGVAPALSAVAGWLGFPSRAAA